MFCIRDAVFAEIQTHTLPGDYNLIVCAMDTAACPCPVGFPFILGEGDLSRIYQGWGMLKYKKDPGTMHNAVMSWKGEVIMKGCRRVDAGL